MPGNNETVEALREAAAVWEAATVLHGEATTIGGVEFFGLGAGIPVTPWDWSFDLDDGAATAMLGDCPEGAILVLHSPPKGHCDSNGGGDHFGSEALLEGIEEKRPRLAVCGHIHESWGCESRIGETPVRNLGPDRHLAATRSGPQPPSNRSALAVFIDRNYPHYLQGGRDGDDQAVASRSRSSSWCSAPSTGAWSASSTRT